MLKYINKVNEYLKKFIDKDIEKGQKRYYNQLFLRFIFLIKYHLKEKQLIRSASALSFDLLLAIIPVFFLGFALLNSFGAFEGGGASLLKYLHENYFPLQTDRFNQILEYLNKQNYATMGSVGVITLVIFSIILFLKIENVLNQLWSVTSKRHISKRFTNFFTFIMLAPIFLSISLHFSSEVKNILQNMTTFSTIIAIFNYIVAEFFIVAMFFSIYFFLPNTKVKISSAAIGAFTASVIFMLLKSSFGIYINVFVINNYKNIFGTMTAFPIFLIWLYLSWVIVLIGGATSYIHQKYKIIWGFKKDFILKKKSKTIEVLTSENLIEIFYIISIRYHKGKGATHLDQISQYFRIQPEVISYIIDRWVENNLIISYEGKYISYVPKKPFNLINIKEVLEPFINTINLVDTSESFKNFITEYQKISDSYINERKIQDLL